MKRPRSAPRGRKATAKPRADRAPGWSLDLSGLRWSRECAQLCKLTPSVGAGRDQVTYGTWWAFPFARAPQFARIGVRLVPGRAFADSPVVHVRHATAATVATRPGNAVPAIVGHRILDGARAWRTAAELLDVEWEELAALHAALGGTDGLRALRTVVFDEGLQRACMSDRPAEGAEAAAEVFRRLDPGTATETYRSYLARAIATGRAPAPAPEAGCWSGALAALAFPWNREATGKAAQERALAAAWQLMHHPPSLDTDWEEPPSHVYGLHGAASESWSMRRRGCWWSVAQSCRRPIERTRAGRRWRR